MIAAESYGDSTESLAETLLSAIEEILFSCTVTTKVSGDSVITSLPVRSEEMAEKRLDITGSRLRSPIASFTSSSFVKKKSVFLRASPKSYRILSLFKI